MTYRHDQRTPTFEDALALCKDMLERRKGHKESEAHNKDPHYHWTFRADQ